MKFATRVSGSAHAEGGSVASEVQLMRPVAPVVSRCRSCCSRPCVMLVRSLCENELASKGGAEGAGSFWNWALVTATGHPADLRGGEIRSVRLFVRSLQRVCADEIGHR